MGKEIYFSPPSRKRYSLIWKGQGQGGIPSPGPLIAIPIINGFILAHVVHVMQVH